MSASTIRTTLRVPLPRDVHEQLRRAVNDLHGFPEGVPFDVLPSEQHKEAHRQIAMAAWSPTVEIDVAADGSLAFRVVDDRDEGSTPARPVVCPSCDHTFLSRDGAVPLHGCRGVKGGS